MTLRLLPVILFLTPITGCIYYESDGSEWDDEDCADCDWWNDDDDTNAPDPDETPDDDTEEPDAPVYTFSLSPDWIVPGDADVALLSVEGEFDLAAVTDVSVLGPVEVQAVLPRQEGLLLVLQADAAAAVGTYHVVLDLQDGSAVLFDDALEVVAAGSGCP